MPEYFIRPMKAAELKEFYKHIEQDFLPEEHAPYAVLYRQLQSGIQEGLVFCKGTRDLAYSICAADHANGYALISLLAVYEEYRGKGIGSAFMGALREMYGHKQAILVEVEKPELSQTPEEEQSRWRRIEFYEKAGFYLIEGIEYSIWDVPMHLMALPLQASRQKVDEGIGQAIYEIYLALMGKHFIYKMRFQKVRGAAGGSHGTENEEPMR